MFEPWRRETGQLVGSVPDAPVPTAAPAPDIFGFSTSCLLEAITCRLSVVDDGRMLICSNSPANVRANSLVRGRQRVPTEEELELGVQFLLKELAFISEASMILSQGKVAYVYHQTMHIFKEILEGEYSFRASTGVGYITVE
jgi:hypothetical protein